jgi:hypothetical protein
MEREIHLMFIYGELQHLGIEGYKEFVVLRKEIKEKREELIYDQMRRRKIFIEKVRDYTVVGISLIFCSFVVIWLLQLMLIAGTE